jgi:hypothetical protein
VNPLESLLAGIAPEHAPALVAGFVAALWLGTLRSPTRSVPARWATALLGVTAAVHLALPLYPHHGAVINAGFVAAGVGYAALARQAHLGRRWRLGAGALVTANLLGYLVVLARGEEADQVGVATALVELAILGLATTSARPARAGLAMMPAELATRPTALTTTPAGPAGLATRPTALATGPAGLATVPRRPGALARFAGASATAALTLVVGIAVWVTSFAAHAHQRDDAAEAAPGHHHHDGRTQAGVLMRPLGEAHYATAGDQATADDLAARTRAATARYADLNAALAAGYRAPLTGLHGTDVHLENPAFKSDGVALDPQRPEMLVYAVDGGRATLLGVVYVMDRAGVPGPQPGGPVTRWHAHNLCLTALPPGIGVVSPYGSCPAFSIAVASPEMMHVWVVDGPQDAFAEGLDATWVKAFNAQHGLPWPHG